SWKRLLAVTAYRGLTEQTRLRLSLHGSMTTKASQVEFASTRTDFRKYATTPRVRGSESISGETHQQLSKHFFSSSHRLTLGCRVGFESRCHQRPTCWSWQATGRWLTATKTESLSFRRSTTTSTRSLGRQAKKSS